MGCDIHAYVEFKHPDDSRWDGWGEEFHLPRNYRVFAQLANVRNYDNINPISMPRGLPDDVSYETEQHNLLFISDRGGDNSVSSERAAEYVKQGCEYKNDHRGKPMWVTHPDWHSHSWVTPGEWASIMDDGIGIEYYAISAALRAFEHHGYMARVVFWFDN